MEKFQIIKKQKTQSSTLGCTVERAQHFVAILAAAFYTSRVLRGDQESIDTWDFLIETLLDRVDQSNVGEVFLAGMKYEEMVTSITALGQDRLLDVVEGQVGTETDFDIIVELIKPALVAS
jgi:hypothetical protein